MKKYKVTQEFMDELEAWKQANLNDDFMMVNEDTIADFSEVINNWWYSNVFNDRERNKRLIAIINWVNGKDTFEIGKQNYIVKRKGYNFFVGNEYLSTDNYSAIHITRDKEKATRFDDFEEASGWSNKHFEVVEVDE